MADNVGDFLHRWAKRDPERTAIIDSGRNDLIRTYGALDREAGKVAARLCELGLGPNDRVGICMSNGLGFVDAWFGAVYAGCTTVPITFTATEHEIAFALEHAGCKALLTDRSRREVAEAGRARSGTNAVVLDEEESKGQTILEPRNPEPGAWAMILYTSGTTGAAKGVCITHNSLIQHTSALVTHTLRLTERDRVLGTLPLSHSFGVRMTLLAPFCAGASTIFVPRFSPEHTVSLCKRHGVTWLPGVPTMFMAWSQTEGEPLASLRWCLSAGAPLAESTRREAEQRLGASVRQAYGLTEATISTMNAPPDIAVAGSVGKPVHGVEVRIEDEEGAELSHGVAGEVVIRGKNVMAGYLHDRTATAHVMRGGWVHSGDVGILDQHGRLTVVDRTKDLILRGGHSIYPSEIENVLAGHPGVADVAVVGRRDDYYGEDVVAVIVPTEAVEPAALDRWIRERLAPYKVPRHLAVVEEMPLGPSGKTLKRRLRELVQSGDLATVPLS